jgi:hypothetical protein
MKYPGSQKGPGRKAAASDDTLAEFKLEWQRQRVFDKFTCLIMYERC